jgi:hypothetical protein
VKALFLNLKIRKRVWLTQFWEQWVWQKQNLTNSKLDELQQTQQTHGKDGSLVRSKASLPLNRRYWYTE